MPLPERARRYWRRNQRLIAVLLTVWFVVSYGLSILFAEPLNRLAVGRLPAGFWWAQQGSIAVFVVLIFVYAWRMDRLDAEYRAQSDDAESTDSQRESE